MKKIIALLLALAMVAALFVGCGEKTEKITLTVWGPAADQDPATGNWLKTMCDKFNEQHPEWDITFEYGVCGENDAATKVTADPSAAGDVYFFANDQIGNLLQANAIAEFGGKNLDAIKAGSSEAMLGSVTYTDGGVYGVPFTGNTWFMMYNKSVYTEEDIKSLDTMLSKGKVAFNTGDGWYLASFYVANGGTLYGETGIDAAAGIDFGGEKGLAVTNYLVDMCNNPNYIVDANNEVGLSLMAEGGCDAFFSGTWKADAAKAALGENFAAAQLPTITINGEAKQMKAFAGSKAIAVNPNCKNPAAAAALAVFLGSAEAQLAHYEMCGVIPCHPELTTNETIMSDPVAKAQLDVIANTSVTQPLVPDMGANYWTPAGNFGGELNNKTITHENAEEKTQAFVDAINGKGGL